MHNMKQQRIIEGNIHKIKHRRRHGVSRESKCSTQIDVEEKKLKEIKKEMKSKLQRKYYIKIKVKRIKNEAKT